MAHIPTQKDSQYVTGVKLVPGVAAFVKYPGKNWQTEIVPDEVALMSKLRPGVFEIIVDGKKRICNVFYISRNVPLKDESLLGTQWAQDALLKDSVAMKPVVEDEIEPAEVDVQFKQASFVKIARRISRS
jgi:hypothetical protein